MNLIDMILSETRNSNIVSEVHDTSRINTGGGAAASLAQRIEAIRAGNWDASEYGISAEVQIARLQATAGNPEALAREDAAMRQRALRRANLDTSNGRINVMVAGVPPWHGLGVNVAQAVDSATALQLSGLNFTVSKQRLSYVFDGQAREQGEAFAIVRDDTGTCLGVVGSVYTPIQNSEGFAFMDEVLGEFGAKYSTAGSIDGGKKVWMQAELPKQYFTIANGYQVETSAIFMNPHDGSGRAYCFPTSKAVVCGNTYRVACADRGKGIGIRHSGSVKTKINDAKAALGLSVNGFGRFRDEAAMLARLRVPSVKSYVHSVLDEVLPVTGEEASKGAEALARSRKPNGYISPEDFSLSVKSCEKEIKTRHEIWNDIIERFEGERCKANGIGGTVFAAFSAVTEHADYVDARRKVGTTQAQASRRFESVLSGDRDELKQIAYRQAMSLAV